MTAEETAYLGLGSNVGDRLANLRQGVHLLSNTPGVRLQAVGGVYETEPVGVRDQPWFLNTAVRVTTALTPEQLLVAAKTVESRVGRTPTFRWGPREIDVDLLLYGDTRIERPDLSIPHPRMLERLFVMLPLKDILARWSAPSGETIDEIVERLSRTQEVRPFPEGVLPH